MKTLKKLSQKEMKSTKGGFVFVVAMVCLAIQVVEVGVFIYMVSQ
jgi:hypothetical protein